MVEFGKDLQRPSSPTPLLRQGHLEHVTREMVRLTGRLRSRAIGTNFSFQNFSWIMDRFKSSNLFNVRVILAHEMGSLPKDMLDQKASLRNSKKHFFLKVLHRHSLGSVAKAHMAVLFCNNELVCYHRPSLFIKTVCEHRLREILLLYKERSLILAILNLKNKS